MSWVKPGNLKLEHDTSRGETKPKFSKLNGVRAEPQSTVQKLHNFSIIHIRDEFGPRPGPARPGPGLIEGHFWGLAHRGPGQFILAQVRPGPEKNGPNSTHRDEFRLRPGLAQPGPGLVEGHFWVLAHHGPGRAGPGPSSAQAGKKRPKLIPNSYLV